MNSLSIIIFLFSFYQTSDSTYVHDKAWYAKERYNMFKLHCIKVIKYPAKHV